MLINCDIGEQGVAHTIDDQLMAYIDIANIACGGHAGNQQSADYYYALAKKYAVKVSVHLSYPDKKNFGREVMAIDDKVLLNSLDQQYQLLNDVKTLKLHGALYNEANRNRQLAQLLISWAENAGITEVLTPQNSEIAKACSQAKQITIIHEVFLDRNYTYSDNSLCLKSRKEADAMIHNTAEAIKQYHSFKKGFLIIDSKEYKIKADTGCVHSDSANALELIRAVKSV